MDHGAILTAIAGWGDDYPIADGRVSLATVGGVAQSPRHARQVVGAVGVYPVEMLVF